ncbi:MAG: hypothetical protein JWQ96_1321 [Segetibacter sp.]|nr:hypothetical protein [Segetibacter sp.]
MEVNTSDLIGLAGVSMLLVAFLLNLLGKLDKDSLVYIVMNIVGAWLACLASYLINYFPFVILEGTWTLVSIIALLRYLTKAKTLRH